MYAGPRRFFSTSRLSTSRLSTPRLSTPCFLTSRLSTSCLLTLCLSTSSCDLLARPGDTKGDQQQARWVNSGRLVVDTDPRLTIVRIGIDSAVTGRHDVLLTRFDFDAPSADAASYELVLGIDFGDTRRLRTGNTFTLGGPGADFRAFGTVTCLCRPLRPDSVRGTYELTRLGMAQITGRVDATFYFTAWDDSRYHATYRLRQRVEGVK